MPYRPKDKKGRGQQFAALPIRQEAEETLVMLVTSRDTGRWVLPKGWAEKGLTGFELAGKEAFEEAGIVGRLATKPVGSYEYQKQLDNAEAITCRVKVFPLKVEAVLDKWPESAQRQRRWFTFAQAAMAVEESDLSELLLRIATMPPRSWLGGNGGSGGTITG